MGLVFYSFNEMQADKLEKKFPTVINHSAEIKFIFPFMEDHAEMIV